MKELADCGDLEGMLKTEKELIEDRSVFTFKISLKSYF